MREPTRRQYLQATGALGAVSLTGTSVDDARTRIDGRPAQEQSGGRQDFLWVYGTILEDDRLRANLFTFAARHDLAVVIQIRAANFEADGALFRRALEHATAAGLDVWLRVGMLTDVTATAFVEDPVAREAHLERLRRVCRVYDDLTQGGRVVLWEEAPVFGQWVEGGEWTSEAVDNLLEHGPRIFDEQERVVDEATTDRPVGIFVHFPYVVDSKSPEVFETLTDRIADRGASPDFAFTDFYRGWYEKDAGPETADDAVRSLVQNAGAALDGKPVFYLAQAHTIDPNHTPSKQSIRSNLRAALEAGADGVGWYDRAKYVPTRQGFDPFVPNAPGASFEDPVATDTVARDRFLYAWLSTFATRESFDRANRFDLWLRGDDLSFFGHRMAARSRDGWNFIGDVDGYADGDYPYGTGERGDVAIVRGLRRDRWLGGGTLDLRIEPGEDARATRLDDVLVMPCNPDAYVAEHEAAALFAGDAPVEQFALGTAGASASLESGAPHHVEIDVQRADPPSLHGLQHPDSLEPVRRLRDAEKRDEFRPRGRFDLWISGDGLSHPDAAPSLLDRHGTARAPAEVSVAAVGRHDVALCYGLERDRFLRDGLALASDGEPGTTVERAYAMPYAGSATFRTPERASALLREQPGEVATYSLDAVDL